MAGLDILIVGAGISGLTAALTLNRSGHRVRIFETAPEIKALGVGINLLPHSVKELWQLDLKEVLEADAVLTAALRYHAKDGKTIWAEPRGIAAGNPWPQYSIHRGTLQMALLDAVNRELGSDAIVTSHHFTHLQQSDKVTAYFRDEATGATLASQSGDCLFGADGIMSAVRAGLYPDEGNPIYSGQVLWRGVTQADAFEDGRTMVMVGNNAVKAVIYPIANLENGRQLINWIAETAVEKTLPDNKGDWNKPGNKSDFIGHFEKWRFDWLDIPALFDGADGCWEFPMVDRDPLPQWSFGRVSLLGDAAHAMRPNGSNGASQGILDAVAAAQALENTRDVPLALHAYESRRLEATAALTLANRQTGPEIVLEMVENRCPDGFDDIYDHFTEEELQEIADSYKKLAGFSRDQLRSSGVKS